MFSARDPVIIERRNLVNISKLIVKELLDTSMKFGRMLDSDHMTLQHFFIVLEHVLRHGLRPKKVTCLMKVRPVASCRLLIIFASLGFIRSEKRVVGYFTNCRKTRSRSSRYYNERSRFTHCQVLVLELPIAQYRCKISTSHVP